MVRIRDVLSLGLAFQMLLLGTTGLSFGAVGAVVAPMTALTAWYDLFLPIAITCLVLGIGLAWWGLDRWPWIAPSGAWNVALLAFGGAMIGMVAGFLLDGLTGPPATPELPSILRTVGWGLGLLLGVVLGRRRDWLVRSD